MSAESILSVFGPPKGYKGDFGYVCGFTAHPDVLREMASRFTEKVRRRRISLAVFLHPPEHYFPFMPGLQILYPRNLDFDLLHAKVALLRFVGDGNSIFRLVVSTGNWTHETLSDSIDLFWSAEWNSFDPKVQVTADILAAAKMFDELKKRFDTSALEPAAEGSPPEEGMRKDIARMQRYRGLPRPRFITNVADALLDEIVERAGNFGGGRRNRLVMGSGFFESGENGVLSNIVERVQAAAHLTASAKIDVILNPANCQGIAEQAENLRDGSNASWHFFAPRCTDSQTWLHAKFLFSAGGQQNCARAWCYIGSGNLSQPGMLVAANRGGNLEAGVVFEPQGLVWERDNPRSVENHLPIGGLEVEPCKLKQGKDFEHPGPGVNAPAVSYLVWKDGYLHLPDTASSPNMQISIIGPGGEKADIPCLWNPPPPAVTLAECLAQVPVLADGGFVLPPPDPMRIEDVLAALPLFPEGSPVDSDCLGGSEEWGAEGMGAPGTEFGEYPVRRIMRLVVGFCDRQPSIKREDWARWTNSCEELLLALTALESDLLKKVRSFGVDPFDALLQPAFLPNWLGQSDDGRTEHARMLDRVRKAWKMEGLQPMFGASQ